MYERIFTTIALDLSDADYDRRSINRENSMTVSTPATPTTWQPAFKAAIANGARPQVAETTGRPEDGTFVCCACGERKLVDEHLAGWISVSEVGPDLPTHGCCCKECCDAK